MKLRQAKKIYSSRGCGRAIHRPAHTWWHAFLRLRPPGSLATSNEANNKGGDQ